MTSKIIEPTGKGRRRGEIAHRLRERWATHGSQLLLIAVVLTAIGMSLRLLYFLPEMLWDYSLRSASDLRMRHVEVHTWFAGLPVYGAVESADYPPASYAILWPLLGWLPLAPARWLWAVTTLLGLGFLAYVCVRESKVSAPVQRLLMALLPFSIYPTAVTILTGQLGVYVLSALVAGLLLLRYGQGRWWEDLLASALLVASLVKPTLAAPFFWLVLIVPGRLRPAMLVSVGYAALTLFAATFQKAGLLALMQGWRGQESNIRIVDGHTNLSKWLAVIGLTELILPVALAALLGLGVWVWRHRRVDFWLLLGVVALVARLWVHHRLYDDLLMLLPMITLFRLARKSPSPDGSDLTAGLLLAALLAAMLAPGEMLFELQGVWRFTQIGLGAIWLTVLVFFINQARLGIVRERQSEGEQEAKNCISLRESKVETGGGPSC